MIHLLFRPRLVRCKYERNDLRIKFSVGLFILALFRMELRCVVAVIRHGDRTPKQKMKVEVRHPKFFEIFEKYNGYKNGHVKLKRPKQLQEILDIAR